MFKVLGELKMLICNGKNFVRIENLLIPIEYFDNVNHVNQKGIVPPTLLKSEIFWEQENFVGEQLVIRSI